MGFAIRHPVQRWTDNTGAPLENGRIYTYAEETTDAQPAYEDADENTSHGTYIQLDQYGKADIFLASELPPYKFVIKDQFGTTIDTIDNVNTNLQGSNFSGITLTNCIISLAQSLSVLGSSIFTGLVTIGNAATGPGSARFLEDTDNGSNYIDITAPSSVTGNRTLTLPDKTGTLIASDGAFTTALPSSAAGASVLEMFEDTDNGSNKVSLKCPASVTSNVSILHPTAAISQQNTSSNLPALYLTHGQTYSETDHTSWLGVPVFLASASQAGGSLSVTLNSNITNVPYFIRGYFTFNGFTDGNVLKLTLGTDLSTMTTSGYSWNNIQNNGTTVTGQDGTAEDSIRLGGTTTTGTASGEGGWGNFLIQTGGDGCRISGTYNFKKTDGTLVTSVFSGYVTFVGTFNAIRISPAAGSISTGYLTVEGIPM